MGKTGQGLAAGCGHAAGVDEWFRAKRLGGGDGISLTVAKLRKRGFAVWIIPHTRKVTNLRARKVGDPVNLETDLLGKYVLRQLNR